MVVCLGVTRLGERNASLHALELLCGPFSMEYDGNTFLLRSGGEHG